MMAVPLPLARTLRATIRRVQPARYAWPATTAGALVDCVVGES
jgi:hypothetical protein